MGKDVIIACDFNSKSQVMEFLDRFGDVKPFIKIGMELYYAEGPDIVRRVKAAGHPVFLDLKLHDIPNTVKKTMSVLSGGCGHHEPPRKRRFRHDEGGAGGLTRPDGTDPFSSR
jgi:orotidine-5'-phosphate decarboxylase